MTSAIQAQETIENGFDVESTHIRCHPPHGYYLNVSIMGLKAYISDDDVLENLSQYGEIKGHVIRLKYKHDHALAGLENGNRLIRMVLTSPSIPYSLNIGGEWCRVIHNNQLIICSNCEETGHSKKNCLLMECCTCHELGPISFHCSSQATRHTETPNDSDTTANTTITQPPNDENNPEAMMESLAEYTDEEEDVEIPPANNTLNEDRRNQTAAKTIDTSASSMENVSETSLSTEITKPNIIATTSKQQHPTDSDSDPAPQRRRQKIKPQPNLNAARRSKTEQDSTSQS